MKSINLSSSPGPLSLHLPCRNFRTARARRRARALRNGNRLDILTWDTQWSHGSSRRSAFFIRVIWNTFNTSEIHLQNIFNTSSIHPQLCSEILAAQNCAVLRIGKLLTKLIVDAGERDDEAGALPNLRPWGCQVGHVKELGLPNTPELNLHARPPRPEASQNV